MSIARMMQMAAAGSAGAGPAPSGWTDPDLGNASYDSVSFSVAGQETNPTGFFFKPDGTEVYVVGSIGDSVSKYTMSAAWDISTMSFSQSFSLATQEATPSGLFFRSDGLIMYVVGSSGDDVNEYGLSTAWDISTASYTRNFSVSAQETGPTDLLFNPDGLTMYVLGAGGDAVNEYELSTAWDISTASYTQNFSVSAQDGSPTGLFFNPDGTIMYVVGAATDSVFEYGLSIAWDISTASYASISVSVSGQTTVPHSVAFKSDGSKMYIVDGPTSTIYQYSTAAAAPAEWTDPDLANASYDSVSFSVAGQDTSAFGLTFKPDGTKMYVSGGVNDSVFEYDLSSAWNLSTLSYLQSFSVSAQAASPYDVKFKSDGTRMFVVDLASDNVSQYDLSTAWDISTASYLSQFNTTTQDNSPIGLFFKPDGTKMYVLGISGDNIYEYDLSSAWDVTTSSFSQSFSVSAQDGNGRGIFFGPNGDKLFLVGLTGDTVFEYNLSTEWDISTASYSSVSFSVSGQDGTPTKVFFKSDGAKMYILGDANNSVFQYSTA